MSTKKVMDAGMASLIKFAALTAAFSATTAPGANQNGRIVFKPSELNRCESVRKRQLSEDRNARPTLKSERPAPGKCAARAMAEITAMRSESSKAPVS